jgi:formiminotetrahydrofolate cyclodeaminase
MESSNTERTIRQFISEVSDQHHVMTGAVIAISATQATALGEACMQISLDNQVDKLNWQDVTTRIKQMARIRDNLLGWCEQDAQAITERIALRETGVQLSSQRFWCEGSAEISRLSIEAAILLQDFRPLVFENVQDDLEITINLLVATARASMLLLDSNLRIWPNPALLEEYEAVRAELEDQVDQLTPVARLRND